ncbi:transporter [Dyella telluris]|uniref:Transporter n=1 Tax=Dyella telluris TaxID=2763498 RepID=A0A7G8Q6V8_9GAMM|nr:transporter [Dyella telluris]QNK02516.1 transporter [Dyella telluris]
MKCTPPSSPLAPRLFVLWLAFLLCLPGACQRTYAQDVAATAAPQSREDAWWTGPMMANSAETLPPGHILLEPYLYDVTSKGSDSFGSRTYMNYGVANNFTMGIIPVFGYNRVSGGPNSSGVQVGDITVQAQYRLRQFHEGSWLPSVAIQLQQSFPSGKYDQLGNRPADGLGTGAYTTTIGINTQTYLWMPNGRILRVRFNVSASFSSRTEVEGVSVYGTDANFRGHARPGDNVFANASLEYSLTRRWVLALDLLYNHNSSTHVSGQEYANGDPFPPDATLGAKSNRYIGFAPAVEYNWSPNIGLLVGVRIIPSGNRTSSSITPAIALNYVH